MKKLRALFLKIIPYLQWVPLLILVISVTVIAFTGTPQGFAFFCYLLIVFSAGVGVMKLQSMIRKLLNED